MTGTRVRAWITDCPDVHGGIWIGDGPPPVIQVDSARVSASDDDLTGEVVAFLRQIAAGELARSAAGPRAEQLADRLDDLN